MVIPTLIYVNHCAGLRHIRVLAFYIIVICTYLRIGSDEIAAGSINGPKINHYRGIDHGVEWDFMGVCKKFLPSCVEENEKVQRIHCIEGEEQGFPNHIVRVAQLDMQKLCWPSGLGREGKETSWKVIWSGWQEGEEVGFAQCQRLQIDQSWEEGKVGIESAERERD
ncbi:hypothetical protein CRG98_033276 [Punica granatum]|uniref:Uncharacterized protein n=1 Tax=Punica granatum TaxID=22663 RepID=A0A2I0IRI8_PUNGR|nr:hypothetical protein CRG98_033276 [Punica granatum]